LDVSVCEYIIILLEKVKGTGDIVQNEMLVLRILRMFRCFTTGSWSYSQVRPWARRQYCHIVLL